MPKGKRLSMNGFPPLAGSVLMDTAEWSSKRMTNRVVSRSTVFVSEKGWRLFFILQSGERFSDVPNMSCREKG